MRVLLDQSPDVPFETANLLVDLPFASRVFPKLAAAPQELPASVLQPLTDPAIPAPQLSIAKASASAVSAIQSANVDEAAKAAAGAGQQVYLRYEGAK